jgi:nucleotide-binding universal stress UspA family protein
MHVLIATDGSQQSIEAARFLRELADPDTVAEVSVLAVVSPLAAVPFVTEGEATSGLDDLSFRRSAERATEALADELRDWGPTISTKVYGGSPSSEIVKAATALNAGLIVLANSGSRAEAVLMGSVAHRVMSHATCPVLVVRPGATSRKRRQE